MADSTIPGLPSVGTVQQTDYVPLSQLGADYKATIAQVSASLASSNVWTPTLGGSATYSAVSGTYTKIGKLVYVRGSITVNAIGSGSTNVISGLPFVVVNSCPGSVSSFSNSSTNVVSLTIEFGGGTSFAQLFSMTAAASGTSANAIFKNGTNVVFSGVYETSS